MIYKILLSSLILISFAFAQEEDCDPSQTSELVKMATDLSLPNCASRENLFKARMGDKKPICGSCKDKFEKISNKIPPLLNKDKLQKKFIESALGEYKKLLTNNLISAARLTALRPTGSSFQKSVSACQLKTIQDFTKSCKSPTAVRMLQEKGLLDNLATEASNELAKILDKKDNTISGTLLNRTKSQCFIPEKDVLLVASKTIEDAFTPDILSYFKSLNINEVDNFDEILNSDDFKSRFGDKSSLIDSASYSHPLLSEYLKTPQIFSNFIKSIPEPLNNDSFSKALYSKDSGDQFDSKLAESCSQSFEKIQSSICSSEFENGNLDLDSFKNHIKLFGTELKFSRGDLANNEEIVRNNEYLLSLCPSSSPSKNLSENNDAISQNLPKKYKEQTFEGFKDEKFSSEIGATTDILCKTKKSDCEKPEAKNTISCLLLENYAKLSNPQSLEFKLANSSNKEVNTLLRSMIGDTSKIDSKTKEILVLNGIIPREDGTLVAQADIPERRPDFFNNPQSATQQAAPAQLAQNSAASKAAMAAPRTPQRDLYSSEQYAQNANFQPGTDMPDLADIMRDSNQNLQEVQDEIMRRLSSLPSNRPTTQEQARSIARNSFQSKGAVLSRTREDALVNRMMARPSTTVAGNDPFFENGQRAELASSTTETAAEKYKKDGMNRALAEMAGARAASGAAANGVNGRSPASTGDDNSKQLTNVALNISNDPQVSLSQQFAEKFNKNDPETQLLKVLVNSKKNFMLTVRNVNFKVVFDQQNNMNLLLDSGDREEAQKLRPQLEIFFRRLKTI